MTIKDCIDKVDNLKPNQYTIKDKVGWLSFIEEIIINEVLKTHEGYDGRYDNFEGYSEDKLSVTLIVPSPYDHLYTEYIKMMIDKENGETARYNNSAASYNSYMSEYRKYYNKTHMPLNAVDKRVVMPSNKATIGLSDAEYENLKKDLTYILTEFFSDTFSADKLYDIVVKYAQNNVEMLKGKKGDTPQKGVDYFTEEEKQEFVGKTISKIDELDIYANKKEFVELSKIKKIVDMLCAKSLVKTTAIELFASEWIKDSDNRYSQVVIIDGVTEYSKVDLQPTANQLAIFYEKDVSFVAENEDGVITVYCIGNPPSHNYVIQATITEVM